MTSVTCSTVNKLPFRVICVDEMSKKGAYLNHDVRFWSGGDGVIDPGKARTRAMVGYFLTSRGVVAALLRPDLGHEQAGTSVGGRIIAACAARGYLYDFYLRLTCSFVLVLKTL